MPANLTSTHAPSLSEAARLARQWAPSLCRGCDWYHGAWPTLRLTGSVSGAKADGSFLMDAYAAQACEGDRVLITGAADHAILELVDRAYQRAGHTPRVTVIDQCDTALALNRWYGEQRGMPVECIRGDAVEYTSNAPFDLVTTHSILSFVPPDQRAALFRNWRRLLVAGGRLVTSQVVRPRYAGPPVRGFSEAEVAEFVLRVQKDAANAPGVPDLAADELARLALRFAVNKSTHVVDDLLGLRHGLEKAHFEVIQMDDVSREALGYRSASPDAAAILFNARLIAIAS